MEERREEWWEERWKSGRRVVEEWWKSGGRVVEERWKSGGKVRRTIYGYSASDCYVKDHSSHELLLLATLSGRAPPRVVWFLKRLGKFTSM